MATEHKDILDTSAHCHYPQGFSAASNSTILTKSAAGALAWQEFTAFLGNLPHGYSYISTPAANTLVSGTFEQVGGTWTNTEATGITWDTDHFEIITPGAYVISFTGSVTIVTNAKTVQLDVNVGSTIAHANVQGYSPIRAKAYAASAQFPMGGTFYIDDLTAADLITPMVTLDDNSDVTFGKLGMFIRFLHS